MTRAPDIFLAEKFPFLQVDRYHPDQTKPAGVHDVAGKFLSETVLTHDQDTTVVVDLIAGWAQAVAIERRSNMATIAEGPSPRARPTAPSRGNDNEKTPPVRV